MVSTLLLSSLAFIILNVIIDAYQSSETQWAEFLALNDACEANTSTSFFPCPDMAANLDALYPSDDGGANPMTYYPCEY